ncbi:MAG: hypothetical protein KDB53_00570, partial [Planctomycetes bacterium]|nr:hypothetical protein [Planctomycetota bacterium]
MSAVDAAAVEQHENEVVIDRGAVMERYRIEPESIEQIFVVARAPSDYGDLVCSLRVDTDLPLRAGHSGLVFAGSHGGVRYGEAVAILASGRRVAMRTVASESGFDLVLPAGEFDDRSFPITIDPLISTISIAGTSIDKIMPDVAFLRDPTGSRDLFLEVNVEVFSAVDHDIAATILDSGGAAIGSFYVDISTESWTAARIAAHQPATALQIPFGHFLVVAERTPQGGGARGI